MSDNVIDIHPNPRPAGVRLSGLRPVSLPTNLVDPDVVEVPRQEWADMKALAYMLRQHAHLLTAWMEEHERGGAA